MRNKTLITMIAAACAEIQERRIADVWMHQTGPFGIGIHIYPSGTDYQRHPKTDCLVKFDWFPDQGPAELETILNALERILEEAK